MYNNNRPRAAIGHSICIECLVYPCKHTKRPRTITPREIDILKLLGYGYTNEQIGKQLGLHTDSIKSYNVRLFAKLGFKNRYDAIVFVFKNPNIFQGREDAIS